MLDHPAALSVQPEQRIAPSVGGSHGETLVNQRRQADPDPNRIAASAGGHRTSDRVRSVEFVEGDEYIVGP